MDISTKNLIGHMLGSTVAIICALTISRYTHQPAIGWGVGAMIMALSGHLFMTPKAKRTLLRGVVGMLFSGIVMGALVYFTDWSIWHSID
jgi:hypothetical protein